MKKNIITMSLLIIMICLAISTENVLAKEDFTITVNGKPVESDVSPYIDHDNMMVPVRFISEALGGNIKYEVSDNYYNSQIVSVSGLNPDDMGLILFINKNRAFVGDSVYKLPISPAIKDGRTFVPLRFLAEYLNCSVAWDSNNRNVIINKNEDFSNDVFEKHFDRRATDKLQKWTLYKTRDGFNRIFKNSCDCI